MTSVNPAITAHDSEQYGDSAEEASTDDDSDFAEEIEGVQHRAMDASDRRSAFELSLEQDRQCAADLDANLKGSGITATTSADHGIVGDNIAGIQAALDNGLGSVTGGDEFMTIKVRAALFSPCVCVFYLVCMPWLLPSTYILCLSCTINAKTDRRLN